MWSLQEEISSLRTKLESIDSNIKNIVASAEEIEAALSAMERKAMGYLSGISYSLEELGAAFAWGVEQLVYHLELQREELKRIIEILEAPLGTEAKELRRRAEFAYRNGWIDEALADFLEAEKINYMDFTVHQAIGNIYLTKNMLAKAEEYYKKAIKYSRPCSQYYTAYALWHLSRVKYLQGEINAAYEATKEAIQLEPNLVQALYDHSKYSALLNKLDESIKHLRKAIELDKNYALRTLVDEEFNSIRNAVNKLLEDLKKEKKNRVEQLLQNYYKLLRVVEKIDEMSKWHDFKEHLRMFQESVDKAGYFSLLGMENDLIEDVWNGFVKLLNSRMKKLSEQIHSLGDRISALERSMRESINKWEEKVILLMWLVWGILGGSIFGFLQWRTSGSVVVGVITGMVFAMLNPVIIFLAFLTAGLLFPLGNRLCRRGYQSIIDSCKAERQALESKLRNLDGLYAKIKALGIDAANVAQ
jgi:tetratricopeptide (TPR) repeat protein